MLSLCQSVCSDLWLDTQFFASKSSNAFFYFITSYRLCLNIFLITTFFAPLGPHCHICLLVFLQSPWRQRRISSNKQCNAISYFWWDHCSPQYAQPKGPFYHFCRDLSSPMILFKDLCKKHCHPKSVKVMIGVWKQINFLSVSLSLHPSLGSPPICPSQPKQPSVCPEPSMTFSWLVKHFPALAHPC